MKKIALIGAFLALTACSSPAEVKEMFSTKDDFTNDIVFATTKERTFMVNGEEESSRQHWCFNKFITYPDYIYDMISLGDYYPSGILGVKIPNKKESYGWDIKLFEDGSVTSYLRTKDATWNGMTIKAVFDWSDVSHPGPTGIVLAESLNVVQERLKEHNVKLADDIKVRPTHEMDASVKALGHTVIFCDPMEDYPGMEIID